MRHSFRFVDDNLNSRLIALLAGSGVKHSVGKNGVIRYSPGDAAFIENELICSIRDGVFPSWQILTCPEDRVSRYRDYMTRRHIPFTEEWIDGKLWFLLPRKYRPHAWKFPDQVLE